MKFYNIIALVLCLAILCGCASGSGGISHPTQTQPVHTDITMATESQTVTTEPVTAPTEQETTPSTEPASTKPSVTEPAETEPTVTVPPVISLLSSMEEEKDSALVRVKDYLPGIRSELTYASSDNPVGRRVYGYTDAFLRYGTVCKLENVCLSLAESDLGIVITDAYRTPDDYDTIRIAEKHQNDWELSHCQGDALDIELYRLSTGEKIPAEDLETYSLAWMLMENNGLRQSRNKTSHFDDPDTYYTLRYKTPYIQTRWQVNSFDTQLYKSFDTSSEILSQLVYGKKVSVLDWRWHCAKIEAGNTTGFVRGGYLTPTDENCLDLALDLVKPTDIYTYEQMRKDIALMEQMYPGVIQTEIIGHSEWGTEIPVIRVGSSDAEHHILIQAAIHGREHMTCWLMMALLDYWLDNDLMGYGDICYHIIPMVNPDGVQISQTATLPDSLEEVYQRDLRKGYTHYGRNEYARRWKSNGEGVDLNRNFDAGWYDMKEHGYPSFERYKGSAPASASEVKALCAYTLAWEFDVTVSYHASGSELFCNYGNDAALNDLCSDLGHEITQASGYPAKASYGLSEGGYKDWAIEKLGIPSVTVEIGDMIAPLALNEAYSVFARNLYVFPAIAQWVLNNCE